MTIIPDAALESHIGILGKTGAGKSNVGAVLAEDLMSSGERICYIDPTGTAWGLRLMPNKKPSKFKPVIFGGEHADIQINEHHGALIADAIASSSDSAIIDTRLMSTAARTRFFTAFAEGLLRTNRSRLHLFVDEAHLFAPQKPTGPQAAAMLSEANELVSRGRSAGLCVTLLSQRPQKLSKDALTQCETLIAMRLIHNLDTRAVEDWVGEWADKKQGAEIVASLPSLPVGTGWVWAPALDHLKKTAFPLAATFDSRKPLARDDASPDLAPLDATALGEKMDAIRQEAMANDPKRLKAKIAELEKQRKELLDHPVAVGGFTAADVQKSYDEGFTKGVAAQRDWSVTAVTQAFKELTAQIEATVQTPAPVAQQKAAPIQSPVRTAAPIVHKAASPPQNVANANGEPMSPSSVKLVDAIVASYPLGMSLETAAKRAGLSKRSSAFSKYLREAASSSRITRREDGRYVAVAAEEGIKAPSGLEDFKRTLPPSYARMLEALEARKDDGLTKDEIADAAGVSRTSSGLGAGLKELVALGLADDFTDGTYRLSQDFA